MLRSLHRPAFLSCRTYSVAPQSAVAADARERLATAIKSAMKSKDTQTSITLRAILAEVHSADKTANRPVDSSTVVSIIKKAAVRRSDAAAQYTAAGRSDLAEKEDSEVALLSQFLPPTLSEAEVDDILSKIIADVPSNPSDDPRKKLGNVFKVFYTIVDKSTVDSDMVKERLNVLLKTVN
ncbi:altered inheritance of mitochondria protein 41 [Favolaschia claudopus]|uniref:Altered inheritance of mitochondria protein 41 n=1 Tax=Favolaschia claudopus TaxID=2862362 RepID=A0AAW0E104_9AGAR